MLQNMISRPSAAQGAKILSEKAGRASGKDLFLKGSNSVPFFVNLKVISIKSLASGKAEIPWSLF